MPPSGGYCSRDVRRTVSSRPAARRISTVRRWKWPAREWMAVPACRSTASTPTPCWRRNSAADRPTRLPPTIRTGTSSLVPRSIADLFRSWLDARQAVENSAIGGYEYRTLLTSIDTAKRGYEPGWRGPEPARRARRAARRAERHAGGRTGRAEPAGNEQHARPAAQALRRPAAGPR